MAKRGRPKKVTLSEQFPGLPSGAVAREIPQSNIKNSNQLQVMPNINLPGLPTDNGKEPLYDGLPLQTFGTTGTLKFGGYFAEEYLPTLTGRAGVLVYDQMFRSDAKVYESTFRTINKLKNAKFYIKPPDKSKGAADRAQGLTYAIFKAPQKVWSDNLNDILSFLIYAFAVLEPSFRQEDHRKYGNMWVVDSYGWRNPKTIFQWFTIKNDIHSIRQIAWGDDFKFIDMPGKACVTLRGKNAKGEEVTRDVPWDELLVFSHLRFGNNYEGISPLRPMYGSYLRKNVLLKTNIVGIENNARGVRVTKVPEAFLGTAKDKLLDAIQEKAAVSNINAIKITDKMDFNYFKTEYQAAACLDTLRSEDNTIAGVTGTEGAMLGTGSVGAKSLGETKDNMHDELIKCYAQYICEKLNNLVKFLEIANYGEQEEYCEMSFDGIDSKGDLQDAQKLAALVAAQLIDPFSPEIRAYVAEHFDLPTIDTEIGIGNTGKDGEASGNGQGEDGIEGKDNTADTKKGTVKDPSEYIKQIVKSNLKTDPKQYSEHTHGVKLGGLGSGRYPAGSGIKEKIYTTGSFSREEKSFIMENGGTPIQVVGHAQEAQERGWEGYKETDNPDSLENSTNANAFLVKEGFTTATIYGNKIGIRGSNDKEIKDMAMMMGVKENNLSEKRFSEKAFVPRRTLNKYETKVNFAEINKRFDDYSEQYGAMIADSFKNYVLPKYKKDLMTALKRGENIHDIPLGKKEKVLGLVKDFCVEVIKEGRKQAISEVASQRKDNAKKNLAEVDPDKLPTGIYSWIKKHAEYSVDTLYDNVKKNVTGQALKDEDSDMSDEQIAFNAEEAGQEYIDKQRNTGADYLAISALNAGRAFTFAQMGDEITGFIHSSILDDTTCDLCEELDQKTFKFGDPDSAEYESPEHFACRCVDIPISIYEEQPDSFDGLDEVIAKSGNKEKLDKLKTLAEVIS